MSQNSIPEDVLTQFESIDAIAEAESGILTCLSNLLYKETSSEDPTPSSPSLLYNIYKLLTDDYNNVLPLTPDIASLIKKLLLAYACKEFAIAEIINALSCKLGLVKGLVPDNKEKCCC
ncbi:hypothetical protein Q3V94_08130 [Caloramator sp. CAR-1]|uniref:hypothetical protein n=1 Tax=Caloramator sp. CAR-1 TaxID=3062777 RepID=UPI0026E4262D|nr:hypothetical protein [Caloramator sp. CAR-1]MDO6355048.1 hypothetical protein [Caloramator sp. CAR-1]